MKRKLQKCLTILGMIGLCIGLSGCGNDKDTAAKSTVPLECGQHILYGSYQGEAIECRADARNGFLFPWTDLCRMRGKPV